MRNALGVKPDEYARQIGKEFDIELIAEVLDKPQYAQGELYFVRMWTVSMNGHKVGGIYTAEEIGVFLDGIVVGLACQSERDTAET